MERTEFTKRVDATEKVERTALNSGRTASNLNVYESDQGATVAADRVDIATREDILTLVETFYTKAFADESIGHIFTEVAHMDLPRHMPIMADFWQTVLFKAGLYSRNALKIHFDIHAKEALTLEHFNRWLQLWTNTVDELFAGDKAEMAKVQAHLIAGSLHRRVTGRPASQYSTISMRPQETVQGDARELQAPEVPGSPKSAPQRDASQMPERQPVGQMPEIQPAEG